MKRYAIAFAGSASSDPWQGYKGITHASSPKQALSSFVVRTLKDRESLRYEGKTFNLASKGALIGLIFKHGSWDYAEAPEQEQAENKMKPLLVSMYEKTKANEQSEWKEVKPGIFTNENGNPGGGLPPVGSEFSSLEQKFNQEFIRQAKKHHPENKEDPEFSYSEAELEEAAGWFIMSEKKLKATDMDDYVGGLLYWYVEGKVVHEKKTYFAYAGVSGV